jgi:hypothetical protein
LLRKRSQRNNWVKGEHSLTLIFKRDVEEIRDKEGVAIAYYSGMEGD